MFSEVRKHFPELLGLTPEAERPHVPVVGRSAERVVSADDSDSPVPSPPASPRDDEPECWICRSSRPEKLVPGGPARRHGVPFGGLAVRVPRLHAGGGVRQRIFRRASEKQDRRPGGKHVNKEALALVVQRAPLLGCRRRRALDARTPAPGAPRHKTTTKTP